MQDDNLADILELSPNVTVFTLLNTSASGAQFSPATATFSFKNELYDGFAGFSNF